MEYKLLCLTCNESYDSSYDSQICKKCHGLLEIEYKFKGEAHKEMVNSFWSYKNMLPDCSAYKYYDVGLTKVINSRTDENLYLKIETQNPTGSFKDRGSVIEVAKAKEYKYKEIVCASTGNMAYSIAYYSKLYNIKTNVYISKDSNPDKIYNIKKTNNANIIKVNGDFTKAQKLAEEHSYKKHAFLAGDYCYRKEGQKTIIYEILSQIKEVKNIIVPIGNATLFSGILKSLTELKESYSKIHLPKIIGVQSKMCKPLYEAYKNNTIVRYEVSKTKADAIAVGYPTFGSQALEYMKQVNSEIVIVAEKEMQEEQKNIFNEYGLIVELASAATIAAYKKLKLNGETVAIITGKNV
ncbi:MAG: pyridoxal-phosphate dependent enzyme [Candidatus Micrarchaeia archaeon]